MRWMLTPLVLAASVTSTWAQQPPSSTTLPDFSIVSIKRSAGTGQSGILYTDDGLVARNAPLLIAIRLAYSRIKSADGEFVAVPEWVRTEPYDIDAKVDVSAVESFRKLSYAEKNSMLQRLLAEQFKLKLHEQSKEQPGYNLVVAKSGTKLKPSDPGPGVTLFDSHEMKAKGYAVASFVVPLTQIVGRTVQDKTGLLGHYDFTLDWASQATSDPADSGPSIFSALEEQLGLRLVPAKVQVKILAIDHVEKPQAN
jgi:bla regulator protein blaR1